MTKNIAPEPELITPPPAAAPIIPEIMPKEAQAAASPGFNVGLVLGVSAAIIAIYFIQKQKEKNQLWVLN